MPREKRTQYQRDSNVRMGISFTNFKSSGKTI